MPIVAEPPLAWACPNLIVPGQAAQSFRFRAREFGTNVRLEARQGGQVLYGQTLARMIVNESMSLAGHWAKAVRAGGGPVRLVVVQ